VSTRDAAPTSHAADGAARSGSPDANAAPTPAATLAVAVGYGTRRVRSRDGSSWTDFQQVSANGLDDDDNLRGVGYGEGVFVAVGGANQGLSMTSTDGVLWQNEHRDLGGWLGDVVYLNGVFIAAGGNGFRVRSIDRAKSWRDATPYAAVHFRAIAAGNGVAVAVGHTYGQNPDQGVSSATADGVTWSPTQRAGAPLRSIAFGNGVFVALGDGGACAVSSDGETWTRTTLSGANAFVGFARNEFLVARQGGYYRSADGKTWTQTASSSARDVAAEFDGHYLAVGWPAAISASTDLETWNEVWSVGGSGMNQIAIDQDQ
jgi:hypothetical protein